MRRCRRTPAGAAASALPTPLLAEVLRGCSSSAPGHARRVAGVGADHDVLERGHVREQADVLERAGDARLGDLVGLAGPTIDRPSSTISPPVGRNTPVTQLNSVVLPAPLGPMIPKIWPRWTVERDVVHGHHAAERPWCRSSQREHAPRPPRRPASTASSGSSHVGRHLGRRCGPASTSPIDLVAPPSAIVAAHARRRCWWPRPARRPADGSGAGPAGRKIIMSTSARPKRKNAVLGDVAGAAAGDVVQEVEQAVAAAGVAQVLGEEADREGAGDDARGRAQAAEHDGGEDEDREGEREGVGVDEADLGGVDPARRARRSTAPTANAQSFILKVGTPMSSAASSSSRMAAHARPTRERLQPGAPGGWR